MKKSYDKDKIRINKKLLFICFFAISLLIYLIIAKPLTSKKGSYTTGTVTHSKSNQTTESVGTGVIAVYDDESKILTISSTSGSVGTIDRDSWISFTDSIYPKTIRFETKVKAPANCQNLFGRRNLGAL